MARSGAVMDWTGVTFTYGASPTAVTITIGEVEDVQWDVEGELKEYTGDNAPGTTHQKLVNQKRKVSLIGADVGKLSTIPAGVEGTLVAIFNDEKNGTGSGALTLTLSNAMATSNKFSGKHNEYGKGTLMFSARWTKSGGTYTDPLAIVEAP